MLNVDYTPPSPLEVTFPDGASVGDTSCAIFGIIDDASLEFDQEFIVSLSSVTPIGPVLSSATTTVTIADDEGSHLLGNLLSGYSSKTSGEQISKSPV